MARGIVRPLAMLVVLSLGLALAACESEPGRPGTVLDEARQAGRTPESFAAADEDYFRDMDGGVRLTPEEVRGRNTWIVWTGGNDRFWDTYLATSFGALDLLKTLSSHPALKFSRDNRWDYLGLVNEPCFEKATGPDPQRFGLWLDKRRADCPPDPFENEEKYPGVRDRRARQEPCRSAPTTARRPASSACGSSRTPPSMRRPRSGGIPSGTTTTRLLHVARTW